MSKAFTREENEGPEFDDFPAIASALPPGMTNYMTARGAERLREELARLIETERPAALAEAKTQADGKRRLALLDQRIGHLEESIGSAHVIEQQPGPAPRVTFGATVTVRDKHGVTNRFRIVGVDEADAEKGCISWISPLAKALINGTRGKLVRVELPGGETELEILKIEYE